MCVWTVWCSFLATWDFCSWIFFSNKFTTRRRQIRDIARTSIHKNRIVACRRRNAAFRRDEIRGDATRRDTLGMRFFFSFFRFFRLKFHKFYARASPERGQSASRSVHLSIRNRWHATRVQRDPSGSLEFTSVWLISFLVSDVWVFRRDYFGLFNTFFLFFFLLFCRLQIGRYEFGAFSDCARSAYYEFPLSHLDVVSE